MAKGRGNGRVEAAFREVYANTPRSVRRSGKTGASRRKMLVAIALSKARARGATIPPGARRTTRGSPEFSAEEIEKGHRVVERPNLWGEEANTQGVIEREPEETSIRSFIPPRNIDFKIQQVDPDVLYRRFEKRRK